MTSCDRYWCREVPKQKKQIKFSVTLNLLLIENGWMISTHTQAFKVRFIQLLHENSLPISTMPNIKICSHILSNLKVEYLHILYEFAQFPLDQLAYTCEINQPASQNSPINPG